MRHLDESLLKSKLDVDAFFIKPIGKAPTQQHEHHGKQQ
jgi:hypothetical protein